MGNHETVSPKTWSGRSQEVVIYDRWSHMEVSTVVWFRIPMFSSPNDYYHYSEETKEILFFIIMRTDFSYNRDPSAL